MYAPLAVPVDPDAPEARRLLRDELAKAPYEAAKPTWFDEASKAVLDWFNSLTAPDGSELGPWLPVILTVLVVVVLVVVFLIVGLPRINRRSKAQPGLFGDDDQRTAAELRRSARAYADSGDWTPAVEEAFRALARGMVERTVVSVSPGTTAHDFAAQAAREFPEHAAALADAAVTFDQVRYGGNAGTEAGYRALTSLDDSVQRTRPALVEAPA